MKQFLLSESAHNQELDEKFHQLNLGNIGYVIYWLKYFEMVASIEGDIVECGVGRGRSLLVILAINDLLNREEGGQRTIYGYDSFEGFPEPSHEDESFRKPKKGEWASSPSGKYQYTIEFIKTVLAESNVSMKNLYLKKGFFKDSLKSHPNKPIAILHIDGDLYQSYISALENMYPKVSDGGIVIFDDFTIEKHGEDKWPGARKAVEDFLGGDVSRMKVSVRGTPYLVK